MIGQVSELGWEIRIGVWKAQALDDLKQLDKAESYFEAMKEILGGMRKITTVEEHLREIDRIRESADAYHAGIKEYLAVTAKQVEFNKTRGEAADNHQRNALGSLGTEQSKTEHN